MLAKVAAFSLLMLAIGQTATARSRMSFWIASQANSLGRGINMTLPTPQLLPNPQLAQVEPSQFIFHGGFFDGRPVRRSKPAVFAVFDERFSRALAARVLSECTVRAQGDCAMLGNLA